MRFKNAVSAAPKPISQSYRPGKTALKSAHRPLVDCHDTQRLTGSVDLDSALAKQSAHSDKSRWDYGLGYRPPQGSECAVWIEVHPAHTSEVKAVVGKVKWLRNWLKNEAGRLKILTGAAPNVPSYVWIATAGVHITRNSPQARNLSANGLGMPLKQLRLP